ncbi:Rieske (2Fe-2S) protein [Burkholderia sp. BCC1972]|uniref:Rieske (2Fe-2S) protein n=1 Tax=Burkholderia sp. BCC1972 TaxID=2817438 RepID=UPI002ABE0ECE|nr:Rieske (2Fe-2S) protein [Burkholderia sp. BCC1972]
MSDDDFVDVMAAADLPVRGQRAACVSGRNILVCRIDTGVYAFANLCPHARQPLEGGIVDARTIHCPRHGARFDVESGQAVNAVTHLPLTTYAARERHGRIEVKVPPLRQQGYLPDFFKSG